MIHCGQYFCVLCTDNIQPCKQGRLAVLFLNSLNATCRQPRQLESDTFMYMYLNEVYSTQHLHLWPISWSLWQFHYQILKCLVIVIGCNWHQSVCCRSWPTKHDTRTLQNNRQQYPLLVSSNYQLPHSPAASFWFCFCNLDISHHAFFP